MTARLKHMAENLRRAIISKDYSQVELAELTGLNRATVSNYFTGRQDPFQESFVKIAEKLDIDPEFLVVAQPEHPAKPDAFLTPLEAQILKVVDDAIAHLLEQDQNAKQSPKEEPAPMLQAAEMPLDERGALNSEVLAILAKLPVKGVRQSLMLVQAVLENYEISRAEKEKEKKGEVG